MVEGEPVPGVWFENTYENGQCPKHILIIVIHYLQKPLKLSHVKFTITEVSPLY